jgi:hypothetical protein
MFEQRGSARCADYRLVDRRPDQPRQGALAQLVTHALQVRARTVAEHDLPAARELQARLAERAAVDRLATEGRQYGETI